MAFTDPTGYISIPPELTRGVAWKQPCRVATTANITIATALNNGDAIDGVTLATGDRVLVKNQSTGSQNGIYVVGATPVRAFDMDQDLTSDVPAEEVVGAFVFVTEGTVNAQTLWRSTNTGAPVIGTTAIAFAQYAASTFALNDLTDVDTTGESSGDRLRFDGTTWKPSALVWRPAMVLDPVSGNYLPVTTGDGDAVMVEA